MTRGGSVVRRSPKRRRSSAAVNPQLRPQTVALLKVTRAPTALAAASTLVAPVTPKPA